MKNNNLFREVLTDISALYELSLVTDPSLDLYKTADVFLQTLMARFNLGFSAVYIKHKELPRILKDDGEAALIYGNPQQNLVAEKIAIDNPLFNQIGQAEFYIVDFERDNVVDVLMEKVHYKGSLIAFPLEEIGFLFLYSANNNFFDNKVGKKIKKVIDKFALSLKFCLSFERLEQEINKRREAEFRLVKIQSQLENLVAKRTFQLQNANEALEEQINKLKHFSLHDPLTGVYNRAFFQQEMERVDKENLSMTLVICDIDGLKLVNDTMGHLRGDELLKNAASIIKKVFSASDSDIARIGGDEFAIFLPNMSIRKIEAIHQKLEEEVSKFNGPNVTFPLSISLGYSTKTDSRTSVFDTFKEADNNLNRAKLHQSQSNRSAVVQTLMQALEARDYITEGHADRLKDMVSQLGKRVGLSERTIADLRLFATFHDIGKVGIPDKMLFKPGPLNKEEKKEMQRHCEIGFKIAQSSPDLTIIADWILKHHEWWNGKGYPLGLKGEEIPIESRILSIVDAYDAMTNDRPYRLALTSEEAIKEIKRCAGTQFDPELADLFIQLDQENYLSQEENKGKMILNVKKTSVYI